MKQSSFGLIQNSIFLKRRGSVDEYQVIVSLLLSTYAACYSGSRTAQCAKDAQNRLSAN
jgi:hypothetical protein